MAAERSSPPEDEPREDEEAMLDPAEADEVIEDDGDIAMDSDEEEGYEEIIHLQNDSAAFFDRHKDSIFCIAQHPTDPKIIATGGGDDLAYVFDATPEPSPVLPTSYEANPQPPERKSLDLIARLEGHKDSVNAITFTLPKGEFLATAGLDGQLLIWKDSDGLKSKWKSYADAQEVEEINWIAACPSPAHPNSLALGASDGSVWVYEISDIPDSPLNIVKAYYLHSESSTAGAWTPDGSLLATISQDGSLYLWDPWGEASAAGLNPPQGGQALVSLTAEDERFRVEGGLYSIAISPGGSLAAVGGTEGMIRVVGLPRLSQAKGKPGQTSMGQGGQILASLQVQSESVESIAFSDPPLTLMAAGSVDGSIVLFDVAHRYAVRRKIEGAHEVEAVIKVEFVKAGPRGANGWILTSCGNDGVVRRWDCRGGTAAAAKGLMKELRGHRGGGDGGGILGFVQGPDGSRIVTAGDE
jgi:ribosome assembly protein SQT1